MRAPFVHNVEGVHLLTLGCADYVKPEMAGDFRHNAIFIGGNAREAVNDGRADSLPVYLGEVQELFTRGSGCSRGHCFQDEIAVQQSVRRRPIASQYLCGWP